MQLQLLKSSSSRITTLRIQFLLNHFSCVLQSTIQMYIYPNLYATSIHILLICLFIWSYFVAKYYTIIIFVACFTSLLQKKNKTKTFYKQLQTIVCMQVLICISVFFELQCPQWCQCIEGNSSYCTQYYVKYM